MSIPLLHIADPTAAAIRRRGARKVALLGTRYTMEERFYVAHLESVGIDCAIPDASDRDEVHRIEPRRRGASRS